MRFLVTFTLLTALGAMTSLQAMVQTDTQPQKPTIEWRTLEINKRQSLEYAVQWPREFDAEKVYPVLIALPPGNQSRQMVEAGFDLYWRAAVDRDWIVVSPAAPEGGSFYSGAERMLPDLLEALRAELNVEGDVFHLAGVSNGGRSAFRVALNWPRDFASLVVLPGMPPTQRDERRLQRLRDLHIAMYVGEHDGGWVEKMQQTSDKLDELGIQHHFEIRPGEQHVMRQLSGAALLDRLDEYRPRDDEDDQQAAPTSMPQN